MICVENSIQLVERLLVCPSKRVPSTRFKIFNEHADVCFRFLYFRMSNVSRYAKMATKDVLMAYCEIPVDIKICTDRASISFA